MISDLFKEVSMKLIFKWIALNLPQIILICGFFVLAIGCFLINLPVGFISTGILLIVLAYLSNQ